MQKLPKHLEISDDKKREFYKSLATMNFIEAAKGIGMGAHYNGDNSLRAIGYRLYKSIRPADIGLSTDVVEMVQSAINERKVSGRVNTDGDMPELLDPEDTKMMVIGGKNKALMILHKKFDRISKSGKAIDKISLSDLAKTFGILFDKSQILKGEATENIAVMAKIDGNMTPEQSLEALLKMREVQQEEKHG